MNLVLTGTELNAEINSINASFEEVQELVSRDDRKISRKMSF